MERNTEGLLGLVQTRLMNCVLETLGLGDKCTTSKATPAEDKPLVKDPDGAPLSGEFSYNIIVGMLLYLAGYSQPNIAYAINHELMLKSVGRYVKVTRKEI